MTAPTLTRPNTPRGNRSGMQQRAERTLANHPHRIELTGGLRSLAWPSICANCGEPTSERDDGPIRKASWSALEPYW